MDDVLELEWLSAGRRERTAVRDALQIGRGHFDVPLLDDPYVSRTPITVKLIDGRPVLDARESPTRILHAGKVVETLDLAPGLAFAVGRTAMQVCQPGQDSEADAGPTVAPVVALSLQIAARELRDAAGTVLTRLSPNECAAMRCIVAAYPRAASVRAIGESLADTAANEFATLRVVQRLRDRLGNYAGLIESAGAEGFRVVLPVRLA